MMLSSIGSLGTCIPSGVFTFLHAASRRNLPPHSSQVYRIYVGALEGANPLAHDDRRAVDGLSGCSGLPLTGLPWPISATFASWVCDAPARLACVPSKRVLMPTWAESCPGFGRVRTGHPLMS